MTVIKLWFHSLALFKKFLYKVIYRNKLKIGKHTTWRKSFFIMIDRGGKLLIGNNCFFNNGCSISVNNCVEIGDGSIFGENVKIYDHNHRFADQNKSIKEQGFSNGSVSIGKHCWIGSNVCILKNTRIGDNCVIGAGCVVSGNIDSNTILKIDSENCFIKEIIR